MLCLLSCLSFNKVGPPSSRRGTLQPTLWKMTLGLTFARKCRIGKAFFFIHIIRDLPVSFHYGALSHNSSPLDLVLEELPLKTPSLNFQTTSWSFWSIKAWRFPSSAFFSSGESASIRCSLIRHYWFSIITKNIQIINIFVLIFCVLFFCVSNIITKKKVHLYTLYIIKVPGLREVLCLLSCLSFNKVGPPFIATGHSSAHFMEDDARINICKEM